MPMQPEPLTDALIESVLPNNLISVEGEATLSTRLAPYYATSLRWLQTSLLGTLELSEEHREIATRAAVIRALVTAIPALDLVATPTGFGVVSTTNMSPASKERVERLISRLSANLEDALIELQETCLTYPEWRAALPGKWYCGSFFTSLRDALPFRTLTASSGAGSAPSASTSSGHTQPDIINLHSMVRGHVSDFERALEEEYLGTPLTTKLLAGYIDGTYDKSHPIVSMIRTAATRYVTAHWKADLYRCPDSHEVWHLARPILTKLKSYPNLHGIWQKTMSRRFHVEPFRNTRPGGYFF